LNIQIKLINEPLAMKTVHRLTTLKQLKALTDPLRLRVLEAFVQRQATTKQVAELLGEKPTKLYHHVQMLEEAGLLRLVETRQNRGTVEKHYRAVARDFTVDRKLLEVNRGTRRATRDYESLVLSALEATLSEARKGIAAGLVRPVEEGRNALMYRQHVSGPEVMIRELTERIRGWIGECQAIESTAGAIQYGVTIAFYPVRKLAGATGAGPRTHGTPAEETPS
jgi:DNA-binding transcriptional ArsR family regulator